jgi:hypothetical protein
MRYVEIRSDSGENGLLRVACNIRLFAAQSVRNSNKTVYAIYKDIGRHDRRTRRLTFEVTREDAGNAGNAENVE